MDGRQRLTALRDFYDNRFFLKGLQYWRELEGRTYSQLPSKVRDGIDRRYISSIILLKETASTEEEGARLKKLVFERLNSGGVKLSPQETRNAVYDGRLNSLCIELSQNQSFRSMWGIPAAPMEENEEPIEASALEEASRKGRNLFEKMEDVELVLRFFAYRQLEHFQGGLNRISDLLDAFLVEGNRFTESVLVAYRSMFEATISLLWELLGDQAFCRIDGADKKGTPLKIIYDPMMWAAAHYRDGGDRERLLERRSRFVVELRVCTQRILNCSSSRGDARIRRIPNNGIER